MDKTFIESKARETEACHNARQSPTFIDEIRFTGQLIRTEKRELLPNESNPALMDSCLVETWSGIFTHRTRYGNAKRASTNTTEYYLYSRVISREHGTHYDLR